MRPLDAIDAGYDEITHINWVMMQAMPDSVIPVSNGIMRFEGPGRYAKDVDLDGSGDHETIIGAMASKRIYSDPTMVAFEGLYVPENGDLSPSYAPFVGTLPPTTERELQDRRLRRAQGPHPRGLPRELGEDGRRCSARCTRRAFRSSRAPTAPASRSCASSKSTCEAGLTPAEALAAATIVPARLVGQDAKTGSMKVGKAADLVLVEGDPSTRIGDLRQTRVVMLDGKLLDADALRSAAGDPGRPK